MRIPPVIILFISAILPVFISCEAPRSNPLDPENEDNTIGTVSGQVQSVSLPRQPLEGASVLWKESNLITETDANGSFIIDKLIPNNGWIVFRKTGYSPDSLYIEWNNNKSISVEAYLNARPTLDSSYFSSIVINKFPTNQKYSVETRVKISDQENDVDSVFLKNEELNFLTGLEYNLSTRHYEQTLSLVDLRIESLDEIIGKNFEVLAMDVTGESFPVGVVNLKTVRLPPGLHQRKSLLIVARPTASNISILMQRGYGSDGPVTHC